MQCTHLKVQCAHGECKAPKLNMCGPLYPRCQSGLSVRYAGPHVSTTWSNRHCIMTGIAATGAELIASSQPCRVTDATIADLRSLYKSLLEEYDYVVPDTWIEGEIPKDLQGTYFRNGPGMQVANERYKRHTFDGDGMVLSFSFSNGRVRFKNKYVRTRGFLDEQAAGRPVYRTAFSRGAADGNPFFNPFDFKLKNVANTGVILWGNRLLALYESGLPHEIDPASLDTVGETNLSGQLQTPVLAAHYRIMPGQQQLQQQQQWDMDNSNTSSNGGSNGSRCGVPTVVGRTFVGFSFNSAAGAAELLFYEFAETGQLAVPPQRYRLPGVSIALIHDIAVTPDYYVVVVGPVDFSVSKFVTEYFTSRCSIAECLLYDPSKPSKVHLVPRPAGAAAGTAPYVMDAPPMFTFHHVNAFQVQPADTSSSSIGSSSSNGSNGSNGSSRHRSSSSSGQLLVLDTIAWDQVSFDANQHNLSPEYYKGGNRSHLQRFVFQLDPLKPAAANSPNSRGSNGGSSVSSSTGWLVGSYRLARRCIEFPSVNWDMHGQPHRYTYSCGDRVDDEFYWGPAQCIMKTTLPDPLAGAQGHVSHVQVNEECWDAGSRCIVNEPLFVPRPNATAEDDGWVLALVHNAATGKGDLVILDAQCVAAGPVATIHLQHFLPAGLHGSFTSAVFGADEGGLSAQPAWKEPNVVRAI